MGAPRFTREIVTAAGDKLLVMIEPEDNTKVIVRDPASSYAHTLDVKAAHQFGQVIVQAARIAAINVIDPTPIKRKADA